MSSRWDVDFLDGFFGRQQTSWGGALLFACCVRKNERLPGLISICKSKNISSQNYTFACV